MKQQVFSGSVSVKMGLNFRGNHVKNKNIDVKNLSLLALTWPIFIEMLLFMLMGNMDIFMLSQYSENAVAAAGVANQFIQMAVVMFGFVSTGASVIISQYLGAEKFKDAKRVGGVSLYCSLAFGIILSLMFGFGRGAILSTMPDLDQVIRGYANTILMWVGGFIFLQGLLAGSSAILRSHGHTRDTLVITASMNVINIVGNYLVLFGPFGLPVFGVKGVAVVTVISRTLALGIAFFLLNRHVGNPFKGISLKAFPFEYAKKILRIGLPAAGENVSYIGYQTFLTTVVAGMGNVALTTRVYSRALNAFMFVLTISIAQGGQIIIGHLMGAKKVDEIYVKCFKILKIATSSSIGIAIVFFIFSETLLGIFTSNPEVIIVGRQVMFVFIFLEIGRAFNIVIIGSLRAVGDVKFPMYVGLCTMWGIGALGGFILGVVLGMGVVGIVIGTAMDECIRGIIMFFRWRSKKWQNKGLVEA